MRKMSTEQHALETLDLSFILRTTMAARGLTVSQLAGMAGVSQSAMEKYLAGPSSPRAVTIANLSWELKLSADLLMFGEIDPHVELAFQLAFKAFANLIEDLKRDPSLAYEFSRHDSDSKEFSEFARDLAFMRAADFRKSFSATRLTSRDEKISFG